MFVAFALWGVFRRVNVETDPDQKNLRPNLCKMYLNDCVREASDTAHKTK